MKQPLFLTLAEVLEIHENQISLYGGTQGIRNLHLLQSALAQPEASFGGTWLHQGLFEMAAAYAFHIASNHPFLDGNKRTALVSTLVFCELNGISISDPSGKLYDAMIQTAKGKMDKQVLAQLFRELHKNASDS